MRKAIPGMNRIMRRLLGSGLVIVGLFSASFNPVMAQCDVDDFVDACAGELGEEYYYLRTFDAEEIEGSTNYPYTGAFLFRKGINYVFAMCEGDAEQGQIVVNLYNRTRKLVASTYNEEAEKYHDKMIFRCSATGIFFVQTLMPLSQGNCGITMLGFTAH